jgi:hypothetical protein
MSMVMWKECSGGIDDITIEEFLYCFKPSQTAASSGFWNFKNRDKSVKLIEGLPPSNHDGRIVISLYVAIIGRGSLKRVRTSSRFEGRDSSSIWCVCVLSLFNFSFVFFVF